MLLSRAEPDLVDAQYSKNQAWKSDKVTFLSFLTLIRELLEKLFNYALQKLRIFLFV